MRKIAHWRERLARSVAPSEKTIRGRPASRSSKCWLSSPLSAWSWGWSAPAC